MRIIPIVLAILMSGAIAYAQPSDAALAAAMKDAKVSLARGLKASEKEGTPISGKFEAEDGKLRLSVYTMKGEKFFEVIVDHKSGKVSATEPITGGDDLAAAQKQAEAMVKTKGSLREAVAKAEKANPGYRAVSVAPEIENGVAVAHVGLLKGTETKEMEEKI